MNYTNSRLRNGDANEGWGYGAGYAINYLKALAIFKTGTNYATDHFTTTTYDEDIIKFLPFASLPDLTHMLPEGDWARESTGELWEYHRLAADLVSSYSDNSQAQQIAVFWANETVPFNKFAVTAFRWFPFLFSNKEITPLDYRTLPFYQSNYIYTDTSGTDQFIRRTGWNSSSQWVSYRAGGRYGDHAHNGSGHFSIYDNGWLLIDKNIKTSSGIEGADSMHNCIHVEKMNNFEMYPFKEPIEHSGCIRRDLNVEYSYLWTNSTPIYQARSQVFNCVTKNQRQFFYLPGIEKIAIFDIVKTTNNYKKWFGLNYDAAPTVSNDSSYSSYSNQQKQVDVHTCYPLAKSISLSGNSVRVGNKPGQSNDYFMHLVNIHSSGSQTANVVSVNRHNGRVILSDFYGSFHEDISKNYCILFAGDDPAFNHDSLIYEVPTNSNLLHTYIAGLNPSGVYYISYQFPGNSLLRIKVSLLNHAGSVPHTTSIGGILSFDISDPLGVANTGKGNLQPHVFYNSEEQLILVEFLSPENKPSSAALYDLNGRLIGSIETHGEKKIHFSTEALPNGVYLIQVEEHGNYYRKKIIIH